VLCCLLLAAAACCWLRLAAAPLLVLCYLPTSGNLQVAAGCWVLPRAATTGFWQSSGCCLLALCAVLVQYSHFLAFVVCSCASLASLVLCCLLLAECWQLLEAAGVLLATVGCSWLAAGSCCRLLAAASCCWLRLVANGCSWWLPGLLLECCWLALAHSACVLLLHGFPCCCAADSCLLTAAAGC